MKKTLYIATLLSIFAFPALADSKTVYYPQEACDEILSQEYSTGGGDRIVQYLEILCKDSQGNYTGFVVSWGSVSGMLGLGRFTIPEKFTYVPYDGNTLMVE